MVPPTPIMTDIIVKIMVELLLVLALATKQINQGLFSKWAATNIACGSIYHREIREEFLSGQQDRGCTPETGSIDPRRGSDICRTDLGCRPWSCWLYEDGYGRCVMFISLSHIRFWRFVPLDGKAPTDSIRQDLGMCHTRNRYHLYWLWFVVALHRVLNKTNKMKRLFVFPPPVAETDGIL